MEAIHSILPTKLDNVGVHASTIEMSAMILSVSGTNKRFIFDASVAKPDSITLFRISKFNNKFLDSASGFDVC
ncbi:hypothetical protein LB328_14800, partial [Staphylococcus aureus]|nr:hypothetical protein [Staphylococcus aureus]